MSILTLPVIIFILLPCCFWINVDKLDESLLKRVLRTLLFLLIFLLEAGGGLLLRVIFILQENYDHGKKASDILKLWEKDPGHSFTLLACPGAEFIFLLWGIVIILSFLACIGAVFSLKKRYEKKHLFFYISLPVLIFPALFFAVHFHKERENSLFFNHYMLEAQKILHDSPKSRQEKSVFISSIREKFPVTYEKPLWKNIKSFPEKFRKGL